MNWFLSCLCFVLLFDFAAQKIRFRLQFLSMPMVAVNRIRNKCVYVLQAHINRYFAFCRCLIWKRKRREREKKKTIKKMSISNCRIMFTSSLIDSTTTTQRKGRRRRRGRERKEETKKKESVKNALNYFWIVFDVWCLPFCCRYETTTFNWKIPSEWDIFFSVVQRRRD